MGLLKRHSVPMDRDFLIDIESNKTFWEETKNKVNAVKAMILPLQG